MTTERKLKIGGEARDGMIVVRENGNAIAIFLPGVARDTTPLQDAHTFVEAKEAVETDQTDALDKVLAEIPPEELSVKLDAALAANPPKPKPGETFTDYMRRSAGAQGLPTGIIDILTNMAKTVDDGSPFPDQTTETVRIRSFDTLEGMLEALGAIESDEETDDCDCGSCILRDHWYTADGTLREGRSLAALIKGIAIVTNKGSDDKEVEEAARRVAARLYIAGISTDSDTGVVGIELPASLDQKAVLAAVAIKMDGFSDVEQIAVH